MGAPQPPFTPSAVVFDLDGLLVDSETAWGRAERQVVEEYGKPWDSEVQLMLLGRSMEEANRILAEYLGVPDPREVGRRVLQATVREFTRGIDPRPGARALVEALDGRIPMAVATNSRHVLADLALESSGLGELLHVVVTSEDVDRPKPAPDPYLEACRRLGADPSEAIGLEDSPAGAASAKAAGLWVIGCPSLEGAEIDAADVLVTSLDEVDPDELLGQARGRGS